MDEPFRPFSPSAFVKKHALHIAKTADGPILDIAGGSGRNAFCLATFGAEVICIDQERKKFEALRQRLSSEPQLLQKVRYHHLDLENDPWIFQQESAGAILCVHYPITEKFLLYCDSLKSGGYLLIETVGGQGGNYAKLPRPGLLYQVFHSDFAMHVYQERAVGPKGADRVAVKLLAQKKQKRDAAISFSGDCKRIPPKR
jgi:SAM-dependent methyltransferase